MMHSCSIVNSGIPEKFLLFMTGHLLFRYIKGYYGFADITTKNTVRLMDKHHLAHVFQSVRILTAC